MCLTRDVLSNDDSLWNAVLSVAKMNKDNLDSGSQFFFHLGVLILNAVAYSVSTSLPPSQSFPSYFKISIYISSNIFKLWREMCFPSQLN